MLTPPSQRLFQRVLAQFLNMFSAGHLSIACHGIPFLPFVLSAQHEETRLRGRSRDLLNVLEGRLVRNLSSMSTATS
jgi:hypothetical protein